MKNFKKIYTGSVKDIYESVANPEELIFSFSDRYSIFDWGEMPDHIPHKGEALALFSHLSFEFLKTNTTHHSLGLVDQNGDSLESIQKTSYLKVKKVQVIPPIKNQSDGSQIKYDYDFYKTKPVGCLLPLEVIFRFGVPEGSSLPQRLEKLKISDLSAYQVKMAELGLKEIPLANELFLEPVIEMTTKLEPTDRFLSETEVINLASLSAAELQLLKEKTKDCAKKLHQFLKHHGVELWDGKFEFALMPGISHREFALVDAIGPDELRLTYQGVQLSKEVLRKIYRNSAWGQVLGKAKDLAKVRGVEDWQKICAEELHEVPQKLPIEMLDLVSKMYCALTNLLSEGTVGIKIFPEVPSLNLVIQDMKQRAL